MQLSPEQIAPQDRIRSDDPVWSGQRVVVHTTQNAIRTPDLMGAFRLNVVFRIEGAFCIGAAPTEATPARGIPREDVDALMEWLRSDSLDWDAVERAREDAWR